MPRLQSHRQQLICKLLLKHATVWRERDRRPVNNPMRHDGGGQVAREHVPVTRAQAVDPPIHARRPGFLDRPVDHRLPSPEPIRAHVPGLIEDGVQVGGVVSAFITHGRVQLVPRVARNAYLPVQGGEQHQATVHPHLPKAHPVRVRPGRVDFVGHGMDHSSVSASCLLSIVVGDGLIGPGGGSR